MSSFPTSEQPASGAAGAIELLRILVQDVRLGKFSALTVRFQITRCGRSGRDLPTPHGLVEVWVSDGEAEIDSPVPVLVVREDGTEVELAPGTHRVTVRPAVVGG